MKSPPWYADGLRFSCTQCGNCCRNGGEYAYVYLSDGEIEAIAEHIGMPVNAFLETYCDRDGDWVTLSMDEPACPFLDEENRCRIYPVRPVQCRTWPFWSDNLDRETWEKSVTQRCPGIGSGPLYSLEEIEERAREADAWMDEAEEESAEMDPRPRDGESPGAGPGEAPQEPAPPMDPAP